MTDRRRSPAELAALVGFAGPSIANAMIARHRPQARIEIEPIASAPTERTDLDRVEPFEPVPTPRDGSAADTAIEVIEVGGAFSEAHYDRVITQLQHARRSTLLDLRPAPGIKLGLFDRMVRDWRAPRGTVPRLVILLGFEPWTMLRAVVARRLSTLADRDVAIEIGYAQQSDSLRDWLAGGGVRHDRLRDVIAWLRTGWSRGPVWPTVLHATARLVQAHAGPDEVPVMLLELAEIARSFPGTEGAEHAAAFAEAPLACIGDPPSRDRCRALRALATATLALGDSAGGVALLETALTTALVLQDPIEEASAWTEMGFHSLRRGGVSRAESRFRVALWLIEPDGPAHHRARLHHGLALALHRLHKDADEAEHHARTARGLRPDPDSQLAREDHALLALIRARRASSRNEVPPPARTPCKTSWNKSYET